MAIETKLTDAKTVKKVEGSLTPTSDPVIVEETITIGPVGRGVPISMSEMEKILSNKLIPVYPLYVKLSDAARANAIIVGGFVRSLLTAFFVRIGADLDSALNADLDGVGFNPFELTPNVYQTSMPSMQRLVAYISANYALICASERATQIIKDLSEVVDWSKERSDPAHTIRVDPAMGCTRDFSGQQLITRLARALYMPAGDILDAAIDLLSTGVGIHNRGFKAGAYLPKTPRSDTSPSVFPYNNASKKDETRLRKLILNHYEEITKTPWLLQQIRIFLAGPTSRSVMYLIRLIESCVELKWKCAPFLSLEFQTETIIRDISADLGRGDIDVLARAFDNATGAESFDAIPMERTWSLRSWLNVNLTRIDGLKTATERFDAVKPLQVAWEQYIDSDMRVTDRMLLVISTLPAEKKKWQVQTIVEWFKYHLDKVESEANVKGKTFDQSLHPQYYGAFVPVSEDVYVTPRRFFDIKSLAQFILELIGPHCTGTFWSRYFPNNHKMNTLLNEDGDADVLTAMRKVVDAKDTPRFYDALGSLLELLCELSADFEDEDEAEDDPGVEQARRRRIADY